MRNTFSRCRHIVCLCLPSCVRPRSLIASRYHNIYFNRLTRHATRMNILNWAHGEPRKDQRPALLRWTKRQRKANNMHHSSSERYSQSRKMREEGMHGRGRSALEKRNLNNLVCKNSDISTRYKIEMSQLETTLWMIHHTRARHDELVDYSTTPWGWNTR